MVALIEGEFHSIFWHPQKIILLLIRFAILMVLMDGCRGRIYCGGYEVKDNKNQEVFSIWRVIAKLMSS